MNQILKMIAGIPIFKELDESYLEMIKDICIEIFFEKDRIIFFEEDTAEGFYIILSGKVKIFKASMDGKEKILHIFGPGSPFGEVPVFSGSRYPANAQALIKCRLLYLPKSAFIDLIAKHPLFSLNMIGLLSRRLREFTLQIEDLSLKEVPSRLASYLIYLSCEQNCEEKVYLTISKGQLASLLGTIPETLSRIFSKMGNQGLIAVDGKTIHLIDREGLKRLSVNGKTLELSNHTAF